jgi:hypothetical protein
MSRHGAPEINVNNHALKSKRYSYICIARMSSQGHKLDIWIDDHVLCNQCKMARSVYIKKTGEFNAPTYKIRFIRE